LLATHVERLPELHDLLYAEHKRSVLVILQAWTLRARTAP